MILTLWCIQATSQGEEAAEQVCYPWPWSGHCHVPALLSAQALGSPNVTGKEGPGSPEGTGKLVSEKEGRAWRQETRRTDESTEAPRQR